MSNDCPCCLPPWAFQFERTEIGWFYSTYGGTIIARFDLKTGARLAELYTLSGQCDDIVVDLDGNIYFGDQNTIVALTIDGAVRWTADTGAFIRGLAVTKDGFIYSAGNSPNIVHKYATADGSEITSGGWPYTPTIGLLGNVCVDQSGNVYICGGPDVSNNHVESMNSSGSQRWLASAGLSSDQGRWCAVNEAGTEVAIATATGIGFGNGQGVRVAASSGALQAVYTHVAAQMWGCCYTSSGDAMFIGYANGSDYTVVKNSTPYKKVGANFAIVAGSDGAEICGWPLNRIDGSNAWGPGDFGGYGLEHWQGRIGALGRR